MSIKQNMKRRMLMVAALAMTVALLAAGTAQAQAQPLPTSLTQTASSPEVVVGEPVTFHITLANEAPYEISPSAFVIYDNLPADVQFVSASSSQGQCSFEPSHGDNGHVDCDLGSIPSGGTVQIDVVVIPQEEGFITNEMRAPMSTSGATVWVEPA